MSLWVGLQKTGTKTEHFRWRGDYSAAALDGMRKRMCFLSIKSCKPILVVTQNKNMNLKVSIIGLL